MWCVIKCQYHSTDPLPNVLWNERGPNPEYTRERREAKCQYHSTDPLPNVLWNERGPNPEYTRERREAPDENDGLLLDQFPCHFPSSYHNLQNLAFYYLRNLAVTIHLENIVQPCPSKTSMVSHCKSLFNNCVQVCLLYSFIRMCTYHKHTKTIQQSTKIM
jgi:hypothetical protein